MMTQCPCCTLALREVGAALAGEIDGTPYAALICTRCQERITKLSGKPADKLLKSTENQLRKHPVNGGQ